jgi:hypothetical protein
MSFREIPRNGKELSEEYVQGPGSRFKMPHCPGMAELLQNLGIQDLIPNEKSQDGR